MERRLVRIFVVLVLSAFLTLPSLAYAQADTWTRKADMPTARGTLASASVNGKIYTFAGTEMWRDIRTSAVEEYDPATDTWTKKADMPAVGIYKPSAKCCCR